MVKHSFDEGKHLHKSRLPFTKSKEAAKAAVLERIESNAASHKQDAKVYPLYTKLALAAGFLLLLAMAASIYYVTGSEEHLNVKSDAHLLSLQDGSAVVLKGGAALQWNNRTWKWLRSVDLHGEAFFEVETGSTFAVHTAHGRVVVLGTSFLVSSSDDALTVACKSGAVAVETSEWGITMLESGDELQINAEGLIVQQVQPESIAPYARRVIHFNDQPLVEVIDAIQKNFGYSFKGSDHKSLRYTGQIDTRMELPQLLDIVCKPFGLDYEIDFDKRRVLILKK